MTQPVGTLSARSDLPNISESRSHNFRIAGLDKLLSHGLLECGEQRKYCQFGDRCGTAQAGVWAEATRDPLRENDSNQKGRNIDD
jgi:hypothetical protein